MSKEFTLWYFRKLIQNSIPPHEILVASNNQISISWIAILVLHSPPTPPQKKKTSRSRVVTRIQSDLLKPHNHQIIRWLRWPFRTTFSGSQFITCGTPTWIATRLLAHGVLVRQETWEFQKLWRGWDEQKLEHEILDVNNMCFARWTANKWRCEHDVNIDNTVASCKKRHSVTHTHKKNVLKTQVYSL